MRIATGYWTVDCASAEDVTGLLTAEEGQLTLTELPCDQLALMRVDEAPCMRRSPSADRERWLKSMVRDESRQGGLLADRLDHLFRTVHPKDRGPYTPAEVAEGINKTVGDRTISSTYIWQLRTGRRDNPTQRHLSALAAFFGVSPMYFFDVAETDRDAVGPDLVAALKDDDVREMALRAAGLSDRSLRAIRDMIESARVVEGLPSAPPL